jgi:iron complex outermembrane receptor protein
VFRDINGVRPETLQIFDNTNREVDLYDAEQLPAQHRQLHAATHPEDFESASADIGRRLELFRFPFTLQLGAQQRTQTRDIRRRNENWTYNGINGDRSVTPFVSPVYRDQYHYYGFRNVPHLSPILVYRAFQANPSLFTKTAAQLVTEETFRINNSQLFEEAVTSWYGQTEFNLLRSRLRVLTGVRYEKTETEGLGALVNPSAVWARNADGSFVRNAAGQRVRRPEAGAANSMEQLRLTHTERGFRAERTYDGYLPEPAPQLQHLRPASSSGPPMRRPTAGPTSTASSRRPSTRPISTKISSAIPPSSRATSPSPTPACARGRRTTTISPSNTTRRTAASSAPGFPKEIKDFFANRAHRDARRHRDARPRSALRRLAREHHPQRRRCGAVTGVEFNVKHSLANSAPWGRHFSVFVNGTKLELEGPSRPPSTRSPREPQLGLQLQPASRHVHGQVELPRQTAPRLAARPRARRLRVGRSPADARLELRIPGEAVVDFLAASERLQRARKVTMRYGSETPDYAKRYLTGAFGVGLTMGLKGTF